MSPLVAALGFKSLADLWHHVPEEGFIIETGIGRGILKQPADYSNVRKRS
jgi:hypothetical protein